MGPDHPSVARALSKRALLLLEQVRGFYSLSCRQTFLSVVCSLFRRNLVRNVTLKGLCPLVTSTLATQGKHAEAEPLFKRSLAIDEEVYGPDHPQVAQDLHNWAGLLRSQVRVFRK